jgi:mRNA-degrading endonuclease RelE of RelBE toxin-antitoxin system
MTIQFPFELIYASPVKQHLRAIDRKYWSLIYSTIEAQLQFEPQAETRNRKPLKVPLAFGGEWEIRFGPDNRFRVFYEIDEEHRIVQILAIGVKQGNQLFIGGKEIKS